MKIKWIKPNGQRVTVAEKEVPPPGFYGKIKNRPRGLTCT